MYGEHIGKYIKFCAAPKHDKTFMMIEDKI